MILYSLCAGLEWKISPRGTFLFLLHLWTCCLCLVEPVLIYTSFFFKSCLEILYIYVLGEGEAYGNLSGMVVFSVKGGKGAPSGSLNNVE